MEGETEVTKPVPITRSPWGKIASTPPCSLEAVMSEELVDQITQDDEKVSQVEKSDSVVTAQDFQDFAALPETQDDFMLAQMMQHEFDREHDQVLKKHEDKYNGDSKLSISFSNFRSVHPHLQDDVDDDSSDDDYDDLMWDEKSTTFHRMPIGKRGVSGRGEAMVSKHDPSICARRNAEKVMEQFPPGIETGDGGKFDFKLSNKVFNKLKLHSIAENKRSKRLHEKKEHSTAEHAIDPRTRLIMYKLVNNEVLESINGVISTGKEAVVFHANGGRIDQQQVPCECAIKVFKTTLNEFKNRAEYVKGDYRFFKDEFKKQNPRRIMKIWADKEKTNLNKMRRHGILCPEVVILKKHVLVMSFIGTNQQPAPKLKEANLNEEQLQSAYQQCLQVVTRLYKDAGLVHADFSEYNTLWHSGCVYVIDVSQAVDLQHPQALVFLLRDCQNLTQFFGRQGVPDVTTGYELFNTITGFGFTGEGEDFLSQIHEYEKNSEHQAQHRGKEYAFDFYDKSIELQQQTHKQFNEEVDIDDL